MEGEFSAHSKLRITFPSRKEMSATMLALKPELHYPAPKRAAVTLVGRGRNLILSVKARNSSALRAVLSSYLRMICAALNTLNELSQRTKAKS